MSKKQFVISKKGIKDNKTVLVKKDDVGIIEAKTKKDAIIYFIKVGKKVKLKSTDFKLIDVRKTGDEFSKKICNVCHKLLDTNKFAKNQNAKNNRSVRRPSCSDCRKHLEGINMDPKEKQKWQKNKPDLEPFECPICGKKTIAGITSKIVLDHNHKTGEIRGWVCDSCNTGIGRFKDDDKILKRAIRYIK